MTPVHISCTNLELPSVVRVEIEKNVHQEFHRFPHFVREAHVTLRDMNGPKGGVDKLCKIELRLYPRGIAVVRSNGASVLEAMNSACSKMRQVVTRLLDKRKTRKLGHRRISLTKGEAYEN